MWSNFTKKNINELIKINKEYVNNNSLLIVKAKNDRNSILNMEDIKYTINKCNINKNKLIKYAKTFWVYDKFINELDDLNNEYLVEWDGNKIYFKCHKDKFDKIKTRLNVFLKMIMFIKGNNKKPLHLYLILSCLKKNIDFESSDIGPKNINSGYTHNIENYIFIWREEEFEKVTFHELIHYFNLDHLHENFKCNLDNNQCIFDKYESLYEAVTDFKAIYYNLIYISILTKKRIIKLFNLEITFMYNQAKMINYLIKKNIKLISPGYSYFILKYLLFKYFSDKATETDYNDIFIEIKNYNILLNKIGNLNEFNYIDFKSSRMSFFELE